MGRGKHDIGGPLYWSGVLLLSALTLTSSALGQEAQEVAEEVPPPPRSGGVPHCHGQSEAAWIVHDVIGLRMNSLGVANTLRAGRCFPLYTDRDSEGIMFALSNVEMGLVNHLAPVYVHVGAYLSFTPISLLTFSAEMTGFSVWPLSLSNSGYLERDGYDDSFSSRGIVQDLGENEAVEAASGMNIALSTTARGRLTLTELRHGGLHLLISDTLAFEYWHSGDADYYWNVKTDAILRGSDWMMTNQAVLLLSYPLTERHSLRFGLFDELLYALGQPGLQRHQIGGLLGIHVSTLGRRLRNFETVLVVTGVTNLPIRVLTIPPINVMLKISLPFPFPS